MKKISKKIATISIRFCTIQTGNNNIPVLSDEKTFVSYLPNVTENNAVKILDLNRENLKINDDEKIVVISVTKERKTYEMDLIDFIKHSTVIESEEK